MTASFKARLIATYRARPKPLTAMFRNLLKPNLTSNVAEKFIVNFADPKIGLSSLLVRSDEDLGGFSTAALDMQKPQAPLPPFARFHGDISLDLPEDRPEVIRLGYAMFRTKDLPSTFFGLGSTAFHDWSEFNQLSLRVRGDYRKYFINIQADTPYPTDLYQHRLFLKTPGQWETVTVSFANFILTNGGVIQQQQHLPLEAVKSIGIGLVDGQYGPYELDIEWIKVHNGLDPEYEGDQVQEKISGEVPTPLGNKHPEAVKNARTPGQRLSVDD